MADGGPDIPSEFDAVVVGTGLTECVLSGLLSTAGMKVLHLDRNAYYGGDCASLNLEQLYAKFNKGKPGEELGRSHQYNVDLIPKVLMCAGELVKILRATVVDRYNMEFMLIENSFVLKGGEIHKVPVTAKEAFDSKLMGFFEKRRAAKFFEWMANYTEEEEAKKGSKGYNLRTMTATELFKAFGLEKGTQDFIGHAVALYTHDEYLTAPAYDMVMRAKLYEESFDMYGGSPYVYPLYGSGELPQAFSRLCAVYGGTYMLDTPVRKVNYGADGAFESITFGKEKETTVKAKFIVGDPSYFQERVKPVGKVVRCIALLDHPIATGQKQPNGSLQIIIPQHELGRKNDMYVLQLGPDNKVCPPGKYVAIVGTIAETSNPEQELAPGLKLLGNVIDTFVSVSDVYEPLDDGKQTKTFISKSYDAQTHFESAAADILGLYERIMGKKYAFDTAPAQVDQA
uniref:Rab GDP dissociation inhibitor n=1 Tax=Neobodo designis TaxID=312471 RepID=A0A7S1L5Y4_NEODS|mmetsp:Transcript_15212/g.47138  ORF Transcript_15212/g.47138 Transcript_15212/m.47138 type:complete len:456 (+) Transcript_15212:57-1424(+)|eukprot:CAMPEP_0174851658 /NCGR_PEP_ID=MMETSP1114-20130205/23304_1 /TAXON_ID=312471 /ORGANISM="Neobodo designis, Strain CCAP 1951/1" /LENGTH=455 /DNA_ID=CAMNT_0016086205 /DNA_START=57 /DNA_END=1424 /DNA_ORIENTATION=-